MKLFQVLDVNPLMNLLLASEVFDLFYVRKTKLCTLFEMTIDGKRNPEWSEEEGAKYLQWRELKPLLYERMKGKMLPKLFELELFLPVEEYQKYFSKQDSETGMLERVYAKMIYEKKALNITTGVSVRGFSLDKEPENTWDETFGEFLKKLKLAWETVG